MISKNTIALIATATVANAAFTPEFFSGAQAGFFLTSEDQFEDYSCALPEMDPMMENAINMIAPFKMMMQNMGGKDAEANPFIPVLTAIEAIAYQAGYLMSVLVGDYEGGDYCAGLIASKEASMLAFQMFGEVFKSIFEDDENNFFAGLF